MTDTPSRSRRPWVHAAAIGGGVLGIVITGLAIAGAVVWSQLPDLGPILDYKPSQPLAILTRDGAEIAQFGPERRRFVPIGQTPKLLQDALIATEDASFREHNGISLKGITRAALANLMHSRSQGGSTITQQVAKNFFLTRKKSYVRKFSEVLLAMKIERALSKERILELYMNQIYLGQRAYGFEAAAMTYYGKPSAQLSVAQTAMLAGLPQNPSYANPITHPERARARQLWVLQRMHETGVIDDAQWEAAKAEAPQAGLKRTGSATSTAKLATGAGTVRGDYLAEMVRRLVVERFGEKAYSEGLRVTTSVLAADQEAATEALRKGILDFDRRQAWRGPEDNEELPETDADIEQAAAAALKEHPDDEDLRVAIVLHASPQQLHLQLASGEQLKLAGDAIKLGQPGLKANAAEALAIERGAIVRVLHLPPDANGRDAGWRLAQWPDTESALVAIDTHTGQLRALVGGFDFTHSQFNHATDAWRQPGSSFKPFLYSAALEAGVMPSTLINDAPLEFEASGGNPAWSPKNSDGQFDGPITLRQALARSKNLVSVRLVQMMGIENARDWAAQFGFDKAKQPDNLTLALGAGSTTPIQLATAYAAIANGGYRIAPRFIEKITDAQGKVLFEAPPPPALDEAARVVPARNAFIVASLLQEVARSGTAAKAQGQLKRPDIYGKTGTTNDAVDAWFAGFQPGVAAVVWMGKDQPASLGARESGGGLSLPIWIDYMRTALKTTPVAEIAPVPGLVQRKGDWMFDDFAEGGEVVSVGVEPAEAGGGVLRSAKAASAASGAEGGEAGASAPAGATAPAPGPASAGR